MTVKGFEFYNSPDSEVNKNSVSIIGAHLNEEIIEKYSSYENALIMGYGDGALIETLKDKFLKMTVLEGAEELCEIAQEKHKADNNITFHHTLFEDFDIQEGESFDVILGNHVLEHVGDPIFVLEKIKTWLSQGGCCILTVPNATSLHRRIGKEMGMMDSVYDLSEQDKKVGHQRVFDLQALLDCVKESCLSILEYGGFNLKLVSQKQMVGWSMELFNAIYKISKECSPELCSNIYVVCKKE